MDVSLSLSRFAWAIIDLPALAHNVSIAQRLAGGKKILAVIKANAYGHGMVEVGQYLQPLVNGLVVARLDEAVELREAGITADLLILCPPIQRETIQWAEAHHCDLVVHHHDDVAQLVNNPPQQPLRIWLKMDSGMHRLGLSPAELVAAHNQLSQLQYIRDIIHCTHLAQADQPQSDFTQKQIDDFIHASSPFRVERSIANSGGLFHYPTSIADWNRPGIMLYGATPANNVASAQQHGLQVVMTLQATLVATRSIASGESVGYGATWRATRPSRIGTIAIGYGDGYPRYGSQQSQVKLGDHLVPIVGKVSMDSLTVDLTDYPDVAIGDVATLWGQGLPINTVARHADTIAYTLMTGIQKRVRKQYLH